MHIIDKEGKVIEGQELTTEDVSILKELTAERGIYGASQEYISSRAVQRVALYLIANFTLARRNPKPSDVQDAEDHLSSIDVEPAPMPVPLAAL